MLAYDLRKQAEAKESLSEVRDRLPEGETMKYELLETVVLERDLPAHGLRRGDLGTVVELYPPRNLEVEFVAASGKTEAVLTVAEDDVRPAADGDLIAVRPSDRST